MANREQYIIELIDKGVSSGLSDVAKNVQALRDKMDGLSNQVGDGKTGLAGRLGGIAKIVGWGAVAGGIGFIGKKVIELGTGMEQTRLSFSTFMGDTEKANKLIGELNNFANVTPFDNAEVLKSGQMLLSAGMSADKVTSSLRMIGDVASGVSMPLDELSQIYMKAMNKGKLQAEELNQMSERGIPLMQELARMTGLSKTEVYKLAENGKITSDVLQQAFSNMTSSGGVYFNLMEKQSKTVQGRWSTVVGNLQTLGIKLGEMLLPVIGAFVDFAGYIVQNKKLLKDIAIVVGIATGAFLVFKGIMIASAMATSGMTIAQYALNLAMSLNPIGLIVTAIALLIAGVVLAIRHFNTWGETVLRMIPGVGLLIDMIQSFRNNWESIKNAFSSEGILGGLKRIGASIVDFMLKPLERFINLVSKIPGMGWLKEKNDKLMKSVREKLGIVTPIEPKKETVKQKETKKTTVEANKRTADGMYKLTGGADEKSKLSTKASNLKSGVSEIQAGAPKTFNINIGSLIKEQKFETVKNMDEMKIIIKNEVSRLLLGVVNDVQTT
jgi:tape measure domain-containing protein